MYFEGPDTIGYMRELYQQRMILARFMVMMIVVAIPIVVVTVMIAGMMIGFIIGIGAISVVQRIQSICRI